MSVTLKRPSLLKSLCKFRHVGIPLLVYSLELTVWAVLNRHGIGGSGWLAWRIALLVFLVILAVTAAAFNKNEIRNAAAGAIAPWLFIPLGITLYGFIRMNLDFVTTDLFFYGVTASGVLQFALAFFSDKFRYR